MKRKTNVIGCVLTLLQAFSGESGSAGEIWIEAWQNADRWDLVGEAMLDPSNPQRLIGKPGTGVLINGEEGKCPSLVSKRRDYRDVKMHLEFLVAKRSNSGVIFHGNYEIQILDSFGASELTAGHCGGVYPPAEADPTYHHLEGGSPPRINAARPPGEWQSMDIVFQAARFDEHGEKTANARFVRVVHNGIVIQEDVEVPQASGTNWDRPQHPQGPIIIQGDYGPIAVRNVRVQDWTPGKAGAGEGLNVPPEGFTELFNGRDFTGWRMNPKAREMWEIEDGVLKAPELLEEWGADLTTQDAYRDFVLMLDFRMPTISDSGINFRKLIPEIPGFGDMEQFNLRSRGGMGHLESYYFLPPETAQRAGLKEAAKPHVRHIDPEIGVWHTVKLTMQGRTLSAEYDGEVLLDGFEYHDWMMNMEPAPIRLQKHKVVYGENLGRVNPCPIEYRNIFIRKLAPRESVVQTANRVSSRIDANGGESLSAHGKLLAEIDQRDLPAGYAPQYHQQYVDRRLADFSAAQRETIGQLWQEKERIDPDMPNRGASFVKILEYVADSASTGYRGSYFVNGEIHVNTYGTPEGKALTSGHQDFKPSWSKTGDWLVFFRRLKNDPVVTNWKTAICIINVDGTGFHQLTDGTHTDFNQTWTRDGSNTPIWNRKNPETGGFQVMKSAMGAKPGQEVALTDKRYHTWAYTCLVDGRILVQCAHPTQGWGYFLMTPNPDGESRYERIDCPLASKGLLDRISLSPSETRVCFEYQLGHRYKDTGRALYIADFDEKEPSITNPVPFANEEGADRWFAYPRWTKDEAAIVYHASPSLYLYTLKDGTTRKVSTNPRADYRYPHTEATPK